MTPPTWHPGPPPHAGWWIASISRSTDYRRYYDGHSWSKPILHISEEPYLLRPVTHDLIEWTHP